MDVVIQVNGLSFKPGTHLLATASDDATSMIWDAEKGIPITTLNVRIVVTLKLEYVLHRLLIVVLSKSKVSLLTTVPLFGSG